MKSKGTNSSTSATDKEKSGIFQQTLKHLPLTILILSLLITLFLWSMYDNSLNERAEEIFADKTTTISSHIVERLHDHEQVLRGAAGLFSVNEATSRADWHRYVSALQLAENHPGILGVGFSTWITQEEKEAHIKKTHAEGFPEYSIHPPGERPAYTSITYIEPFNADNLRAFGFDMYSEPVRRAAMDKARDGNITSIAAKIILVQETDKNKQSGMLIYVPVYHQDMPLESVEERHAAFIGFAYSPIRMNDFVYGTFKQLPQDIAFDISIVGDKTADSLMFSSIQAEQLAVPEDYRPVITKSTTLQAYGCSWQFTFKTLPGFNKELNRKQSYLFLCIGILFSMLCSYMAFLMMKLKNQAIRRADEKIDQLGQRLSLATDSAKIGVWEYLVPEKQLIWDKWMYALYGVREEDISGAYQAWQNGLHPDDKPSGDAAINLALRGEKDFDIEFRVVWPTGEIRYIKANALVLRDATGNPLRMIGTNYDISKRKLAEQQMKESNEILALILNSVGQAIYGIDLNGCCTFCNQACIDIIGYASEDELLGKNMHDLIHHTLPDGSHFTEHECKIFRAFQLGQGAHVDDELFWRKDGSPFPCEYWSYPQYKNGEIVGAVITFFNITERRQMLEELHHAVNTAEAANRAKSEFLANMSHEIRTPMNAVMGMLYLLQRTGLSSRQLDYAQKIQTASQTLLSILNDILDFSKIEAGKLELENRPFSLSELLRNLSVILSSAVQDKEVEVLFSIDGTIPQALQGDGLRLQQVLLNLASNAIKFTEHGEVIISVQPVAVTAERAELEFAVRDTGIGIAPEMLGQIFSGFVQAEASTTRRFGGTGLGLSISNQLVGLMGGVLAVESEPGRGSTFHFDVSFERDRAAPPEERRKPHPGDSGSPDRPVTVLIVDDNTTAREVLAAMVTSFGWLVETASSGSEAIALVEQKTRSHFPYDVILMDWKMPGMDGLEAAGRIRGLRHGDTAPVVIMVTAHSREFLTGHVAEESSPLDGFLIKPVTPSMLFDAVSDVTSGRYALTNVPNRTAVNSHRLSGLRLLVAEDNLLNQQIAEEILTYEGATVALAASGRQAIDVILREAQFDAVLMDIQMPDMDGYEATLHIRNVLGLRELPIIAMTANAMPADRERCLEVGMNDHVGKPFDVDDLIAVVRRNCGMPVETEPGAITMESVISLNRPGFECEAALKRLGNNRNLYARMARGFEKDQGAVMEILRQNLSANELHTIKGVAATLGAMALSRAAAEGETALKNNDTPERIKALFQEVERFFNEACSVFPDVAEELAPLPPQAEAGATMEREEIITTLVELEALLKAGNMRAMQLYIETKAGLECALHEQLIPLDEVMQRLEFSAAAELCLKIREELA